MVCAKCESYNVTVSYTVPGKHNVIYRRRKCLDCGNIFFTMEMEIVDNQFFREEWIEADKIKRGRV